MTKKQKNKYLEILNKMDVPSLVSIVNNGKIYVANSKEQVADLLLACRIEGINTKGYQIPDIAKTELPVFFSFATFDFCTFFLLHSHEFEKVQIEMNTVFQNAIKNIKKLDNFKNQMEIALINNPRNDVAYVFPHNVIGYVNEPDTPEIMPYPEDMEVILP